jgi:hypothetical protein
MRIGQFNETYSIIIAKVKYVWLCHFGYIDGQHMGLTNVK